MGQALRRSLDLNQLVEETTRVLRASLSARAAIRWQPAPGLPPFKGDPGQIQRLVTNLLLNAVEATDPRGGVVTVRTGLQELDPEDLVRDFQGQGLNPGRHLLLEVSDDGPGMPLEVQERIFEPFFTTKSTGRGLGLSAVQGILRAHEGGVHIQSAPAQGTCFRILLPAAPAHSALEPEPAQEAAPILAAGPPPPPLADFRGAGRILVVDDEPMVRAVASGALRRMGFDPVEARDGREALDLALASPESIRLVLLDFIMPEMDGAQAYRELRQAGFRAPVVLTSGFGRSEAIHRFKGKGLAGFLPKPYRFQTLAEVVRNALMREADGRDHAAREPVTWNPELESGLALLDAGHQALFAAYNRLAAAARGRGGEEWQRLLAEFNAVRRAHHTFEENLMASTGFPERQPHRTAHQRLDAELERVHRQLGSEELEVTPALLDFIEGLIFCHEEGEDRTLISYMKGKG
jgi:hemerythrin-like metal-binding protein